MPAGTNLRIRPGGDYFDWQTLPDGKLAISLGDATGHGIGPALVSALCRAYVRASFRLRANTITFLERLNSLLAADLSSNRFVTFAALFLNPETSEVEVMLGRVMGQYSGIVTQLTSWKHLEAQGIPLGMISGMTYENSGPKYLDSGDMIVVVTDGFYEWENPEGEEFGIARLEETIRQARNCSAKR